MKLSQQMQQMRGLIGTPEKWTKGAMARNLKDSVVSVDSDFAVCFCSIGIICRKRDFKDGVVQYYLMESMSIIEGRNIHIADFNDSSPHWRVMFAWDKAIALCQLDEEMGL